MELFQTVKAEDIKKLDFSQLGELCAGLRRFLIDNISKTGGHLASSLGAVELIVALHRAFDSETDRLIFDVGHQCYAHKLLTGRGDAFQTLRSLGGMSGFPKPSESVHDAFIGGHASTSVSAALGMARARTRSGEDYSVVAVMGDGALTGGLAYEGLNDAGQSGEPLIVVLNDNGMSISKSVGGISERLARFRSRTSYFKLKKLYHKTVFKIPGGRRLHRFLHNVKTAVRDALLPGSLFENMGFTYLGPADGHDIAKMCQLFENARDLRRPVLIHVKTLKGKGYLFSEREPSAYHGVGVFDVLKGKGQADLDFSSVFGETMAELARRDARVCAVTAAMADGTGLSAFKHEFQARFFDVGIAEGHAVTMAAGMAKQGMIPICAIYSSFLQRAYDMMIQDVCMQNLHVVFAIDRAGLVGEDGETHHGVFDVGFLCQMPNMKVLCPSNYAELRAAIEHAVLYETGPVAVRYPRGAQGAYIENSMDRPVKLLRRGAGAAIITYGRLAGAALEAAGLLAARGIEADVLKLNTIKPLDMELIFSSLSQTGFIVVAEECVPGGSVGQAIASYAAQNGVRNDKIILLDTGDRFITHGKAAQLLNLCGLDAEGIARAVLEACKSERKKEA